MTVTNLLTLKKKHHQILIPKTFPQPENTNIPLRKLLYYSNFLIIHFVSHRLRAIILSVFVVLCLFYWNSFRNKFYGPVIADILIFLRIYIQSDREQEGFFGNEMLYWDTST